MRTNIMSTIYRLLFTLHALAASTLIEASESAVLTQHAAERHKNTTFLLEIIRSDKPGRLKLLEALL